MLDPVMEVDLGKVQDLKTELDSVECLVMDSESAVLVQDLVEGLDQGKALDLATEQDLAMVEELKEGALEAVVQQSRYPFHYHYQAL
jgi:hypothetical protein